MLEIMEISSFPLVVHWKAVMAVAAVATKQNGHEWAIMGGFVKMVWVFDYKLK